MSLPETFVPEFHDTISERKMEYLPFGKTGLRVSKISLGGGTLAGTFYGWVNTYMIIERTLSFERNIF